MTILAVALGGAIGAVSRLGLGHLVIGTAGAALPWATFVVNVAGCLALGFLAAKAALGGPA